MISVILDLKLQPRKEEIIVEILLRLYEIKMYEETLLQFERIGNDTEKIIVKTSALESKEKDETIECPIYLDMHNIEKIFTTNCNHTFCTICTSQFMQKDTYNKCPMCRRKITTLELKIFNPSSDVLGEREYSL